MEQDRRPRSPRYRLGGLGVDLAAAVAGLALVGYWIDRHYGTAPKGLIIGALLGLVGGMYNFLRIAFAATREAEKDKSDRDGGPEGPAAS
jgi:F0F1-type ATP synthase assembly protein I